MPIIAMTASAYAEDQAACDHPIMRLGVCQLLAGGWPEARIDEPESVEETMAHIQAQPVRLIMPDLSLPYASSTEAPARMPRVACGTPILVHGLTDPG